MKTHILAAIFALSIAGAAYAEEAATPVAPPAEAAAPAAPAAAAAAVGVGDIIFTSDGHRVGRVNNIRQGNPNIIYNSRVIVVPASTVSVVDGRFVTSLTRSEVNAL